MARVKSLWHFQAMATTERPANVGILAMEWYAPQTYVSQTSLEPQDGWGAKPDTLYVFDLPLPDDWTPTAVDGEVESFERVAVADLLDRLARDDDAWKPNVGTVLVDFVLRHGFVDPDEADYLELVDALRAGSCR